MKKVKHDPKRVEVLQSILDYYKKGDNKLSDLEAFAVMKKIHEIDYMPDSPAVRAMSENEKWEIFLGFLAIKAPDLLAKATAEFEKSGFDIKNPAHGKVILSASEIKTEFRKALRASKGAFEATMKKLTKPKAVVKSR